MKKIICDKCKKEVQKYVLLNVMGDRSFELCKKCYNQFLEWIEILHIEAEVDESGLNE